MEESDRRLMKHYLDIFLEELRKAMENLRITGVSDETRI
jgi:hypothetical protein